MKSLEILKKEHGLIRHALDIYSLAKEELEMGECPAKEFFEKAIEFSRTFADRFHHFIEDQIFFEWLKKNFRKTTIACFWSNSSMKKKGSAPKIFLNTAGSWSLK